jgi:hypothetical protein
LFTGKRITAINGGAPVFAFFRSDCIAHLRFDGLLNSEI